MVPHCDPTVSRDSSPKSIDRTGATAGRLTLHEEFPLGIRSDPRPGTGMTDKEATPVVQETAVERKSDGIC